MAVSNTGLGQVSNVTLVLAIVLYALAMLAYACDLAFGKRRAAAAVPSRHRPERVETAAFVGAPSGAELAGHAFPADPADPSELADLGSGSAAGGTAVNGAAGSGIGQVRPGSSGLAEPAVGRARLR